MAIESRYAMTVDTLRCVGCSACTLNCKAENAVPDGAFRCRVVTETTGTYPVLAMEIRSERCNHCSDAPCVSNCPTGASYYAKGGVVLVDHDLCTGCKACVAACPYEARFIHEDGYADKCTFCFHRVARGLDPACVTNCPTSALAFGDTSDPLSEISKLLRTREHKVRQPEEGTNPHVFYLT
jgi:Fe-S-cluster-containing dehydrogenase component